MSSVIRILPDITPRLVSIYHIKGELVLKEGGLLADSTVSSIGLNLPDRGRRILLLVKLSSALVSRMSLLT